MSVYLDTSALIRFADSSHPSSDAIDRYLTLNNLWEDIRISDLCELECRRVSVREASNGNSDFSDAIYNLIAALPNEQLSIDSSVMSRAFEIPHVIKSLDAIHLGMVSEYGQSILITYDKQMIGVAEKLVSTPGWGARFEVVSP